MHGSHEHKSSDASAVTPTLTRIREACRGALVPRFELASSSVPVLHTLSRSCLRARDTRLYERAPDTPQPLGISPEYLLMRLLLASLRSCLDEAIAALPDPRKPDGAARDSYA